VTTSAGLARLLLDRYGAATLPGSAVGEPPGALRLRLATALLYGDSEEQQEPGLAADDPTTLPSISAALAWLSEILTSLANPASGVAGSLGRRAEQPTAIAVGDRPRRPDLRASPGPLFSPGHESQPPPGS
jgi:hypothetical protein